MVSKNMAKLGNQRSVIREAFEFGRRRAEVVGHENVFDFSIGNPSVPAPAAVKSAFLQVLSEVDPVTVHGYTTAAGCNEARDAIANSLNRKFGSSFTRRNLYLTCGAAAALTATFKALTIDNDTEFIAIAPYFPEYSCFATTAGAKLAVVPADTDSFQIRFDELEKLINPHTQALIVNSPNNPCGAVYSAETLRRLADLLTEKSIEVGHTIYLISDEPYRELWYGEQPPFAIDFYKNTIVCYSYSKSLSLPGERIGYVLVDDNIEDFDEVCDAIAGSARSQGYVCAPSVLQRVIALCSDWNVEPDLTAYRKNRDTLYGGLAEIGYRCAPPDGAFYLFAEAPNGDADEFCNLAREKDLLLVPGRSFGCPTFMRISYCVAHQTIVRALPIFRELYELCKR